MSRNESLEEQVAEALETTPELLPFLPELLADLDELGTEVRDIVELLRPRGLPAGARVLDLGCGKGTVALALARELGFRVLGVDGFVPFVEEASRHAAERGLAGACEFRQGDLREAVREVGGMDVVMLLAVGRVLGDAAETVEALRRCVRPGGVHRHQRLLRGRGRGAGVLGGPGGLRAPGGDPAPDAVAWGPVGG